jgi:hypothetical protein
MSVHDTENALKQARQGHVYLSGITSQHSVAFLYWQEALLYTLTILSCSNDPIKDRADGLEITNFYLKRQDYF